MKKFIIILSLILLITTPSYALNFFEKLPYKEVVIKSYSQKVLVTRFTGEVKYLWQGVTAVRFNGETIPKDGEWVLIENENMKKMWQDIYAQEIERAKKNR